MLPTSYELSRGWLLPSVSAQPDALEGLPGTPGMAAWSLSGKGCWQGKVWSSLYLEGALAAGWKTAGSELAGGGGAPGRTAGRTLAGERPMHRNLGWSVGLKDEAQVSSSRKQ